MPEPFGPTMAKTSPFSTRRLIFAEGPKLGALSFAERKTAEHAVKGMPIEMIQLGDVLDGNHGNSLTVPHVYPNSIYFSSMLRRIPRDNGNENPIRQN